MKKILFIMMLPLLAACSGSSDDDGSGNTTDVAVTGNVKEVGKSYAMVYGYVNLQLLSTDKKVTIGAECFPKESGIKPGCRNTTQTIEGNRITVKLSETLAPGTTYKYRTFVTSNNLSYYGEYKEFTTVASDGLATTGDIVEVKSTSAVVSATVNWAGDNGNESFNAGIAYSEKKELLSEDVPIGVGYNTVFNNVGYVFERERRSSFSLELPDLKPNTHYYCCAFSKIGCMCFFEEIKEFTTK